MNAILKPQTEQTELSQALARRAANQQADAEKARRQESALSDIRAAEQSAAALDALKAKRTQALADIQVDGHTATDLQALDMEIASAETKHKPIAELADVAAVVRERLTAQRAMLRTELLQIEAQLPAIAHAQLRGRLAASSVDFTTTLDYFLDMYVEAFALAKACDMLAPRVNSAIASGSNLAAQLEIPMPLHNAFLSTEKPRVLAVEIEARARQLLNELSA